jgi:aromatic-L-amino-acid/L-tryptophan decarboxylase
MEVTEHIEELAALESVAKQLEPDVTERATLSSRAFNYANDFINSLGQAPGFSEATNDCLRSMHVKEEPAPMEQLFEILRTEVDDGGINSASGRDMGYIPNGGLYTSAIADFLAAATNRFSGMAYSSPGAVEIENQVIRWAASLVGFSPSAHGNLTSGGSIANLIAVKTARDFHRISSTNIKTSVVYFTRQVHHCIFKALDTTGLSEVVQRTIPVDHHFRMDTTALFNQLQADSEAGLTPFMVIASAGTTNTGAIDPLNEIAGLSKQFNAWFHVDAAYGGFFMLVDEMRYKFRGIEKANSIVMDPHKTLFVPYGSGLVLVRNRRALLDSHSHQAAYLEDAYTSDVIDPADTGPELSRHSRGLRIWLPLHLHGLAPFRANLAEKILLCRLFQSEARKMGFETGPEPDLSVAIFRLPDDPRNHKNEKFLRKLHQDGKIFFSSTTIDGCLWIRCAIVSFRTHLQEVLEALQMIRRIGDSVFNDEPVTGLAKDVAQKISCSLELMEQ